LPNGGSAVTATASRTPDGLALTLINRHLDQGASVRVNCADAPRQANGQMLTADSPTAGNSGAQPDRVAPSHLPIANDGRDAWRIELPPHTLATVLFRSAL
jgi:alpha-L-arabinofuranosidase